MSRGIGAAKCDFQLVVNQIKEEYVEKWEKIKKYLSESRVLICKINDFEIQTMSW